MDTITLIGAENISRAGWQMHDAAERMANVSANMQSVFEAHQRFLDDWLLRFEAVLDKGRLRGDE